MEQTRQFRVADPHAPRFVTKKYDILVLKNKDFYRRLKEQYPELKQYNNSEILRFIEHTNNAIAQEVIDNRNGVRLSDGLGIVVAGACQLSEKAMAKNRDYKTSALLGEHVSHTNLHSDCYVAKVKYTSELDGHMFDNHKLWMFDPSRPLARAVSAQFKNGNHKDYIVFSPMTRMSTIFRKQKPLKESARAESKRKTRLDTYDEFAFN